MDDDFRTEVKTLQKEAQLAIEQAITEVQRSFGNPPIHSGIGMRKLRPSLYEARTELGERLLFEDRKESLFFFKIGNHKEIQNYLKSL